MGHQQEIVIRKENKTRLKLKDNWQQQTDAAQW